MTYRKFKDTYRPGDWKVIDDRSGFVIWASDAVHGYYGEITDARGYNEPDESVFPMAPVYEMPLPFTSPEPADNEIDENSWITESDL